MTKINKKILPALLVTIIFIFTALACAPIRAFAEAHGNFYIPDGAVPCGDEFTVTAEFTASENIGTVSASVSYNEDQIEFISSDNASGGGGIININGFPESPSASMTVELHFRALREGSARLDLVNGSVMTPDGISLSNAITAYATVTIGPEAPQSESGSSDSESVSSPSEPKAVLSALNIPTGELKPAFSPGIYDYTVTVPHDVDTFEMEGVTGSETDTIWYEGAVYLYDGANVQTITVTSADGLVSNVYTVTIYREPAEDTEEEYETDSAEEPEEAEQTVSETAVTSAESKAPISDIDDGKTGMDDLRDKLMPALCVAMAVIVLAVIILIFWIRSKSKNKLK